jgi:predicted permease
MESFLLDARYALRRLRLAPGFTIVAALIIGAGIGGNTAIFSLVNAVLLRPQPYDRPEELVNIYVSDSDGETFTTASYPDFRAISESGWFGDVIGFDANIVNRVTPDGARLHFIEAASGDYWRVLGLHPHLGRAFTTEDDRPGASAVALVGYRVWQRDFGGDSSLVGQSINLNGVPVTVIGIGPRNYDGVIVGLGTELWLPSSTMGVVDPDYGTRLDNRNTRGTWIRARLKPGQTVAQAQAVMSTMMSNLAVEWPASNEGRQALVVSSARVRFHPSVDRVLAPVAAFLMIVVALVLAIACSNLANLLLAGASRRQREVAIRMALGAERGRLVRQFLVESTALGLLGGLVGLAIAVVLVRVLVTFQPPIAIPVALNVGIDGTVLAFTAVLALGTGILFGLAPAMRASRPDLVSALKTESTGLGTRHRRFGLRNVLVVSQVSGSLLLLVVAGLLVRHLVNSQRIDPGFETERIAMLSLSPGLARVDSARARAIEVQYLDRLAARPDVRSVALTDRVPLGTMVRTGDFSIDGVTPPPGKDAHEIDFGGIGPG